LEFCARDLTVAKAMFIQEEGQQKFIVISEYFPYDSDDCQQNAELRDTISYCTSCSKDCNA
jgi:hypothetical protein